MKFYRNSKFNENQTNVKQNKTCQIHVRVTEEEKAQLKKTATKAGLTITELISARLKDMPVKNYEKETEFLLKANELTQELGHIGNNINQATIAIHQMKSAQVPIHPAVTEFNNLIRQYLEKRQELTEDLKKLFS